MIRVSSIVFSLVAVIGVAASAHATTINVNVAGGGNNLDNTDQTGFTPLDPNGLRWNDVGGTITNANLLDSTGALSGIGVSQTDDGGNGNDAFTFSQSPGLNADGVDIVDGYLAANESFGGGGFNDPVQFTFTGLDPSLSYVFSFVATGDGGGQGATLELGGQTLVTTGVAAGAAATTGLVEGANFVTFAPIQSATGELVLSLTPGPGNGDFAAISGFQIQVIPEPTAGLLAAFSLLTCGLVARRQK